MKTYTVWRGLSIDAICPASQALGGEVQCPATIAVDQKITNNPSEWTAGCSGFTNELPSVTVYDGLPEQAASLYSDGKTDAKGVVLTWQRAPTDRCNWTTCGYSNTAGSSP